MKWLWTKDLIILKKQSKLILIAPVLAILNMLFFEKFGILIGMTIFSLTNSFIMLNSLTLDQQNHGMMYLMTLPIQRKQFVLQKYLLLVSTVVLSITIITVIGSIFKILFNWDISYSIILIQVFLFGFGILIILVTTMQYQLKHGPEKASIMMSMIGASVSVIIGGIYAFVRFTDFGKDVYQKIITFYFNHGSTPFLITFTIIGIVIVSFSCLKSIKTIETMEIQ